MIVVVVVILSTFITAQTMSTGGRGLCYI